MNTEQLLWTATQISNEMVAATSTDVFIGTRSFNLTSDTPQAAYDREKVRDDLLAVRGIYPQLTPCGHWWVTDEFGKHIYDIGGVFDTVPEAIDAACVYVYGREVKGK